MTSHQRKRARTRSYPGLSVSRIGRGRGSLTRTDWLIAAALIVLGATGFVMAHRRHAPVQSFTMAGRGGDVRLSLAEIADGRARFFRYFTDTGREVRFFVVQSPDGEAHAAFDACQPCYLERRGYRQAGTSLVCNYCGKSFHSALVDRQEGRCHPVRLEQTDEGGAITLRAAALEQGASFFQ